MKASFDKYKSWISHNKKVIHFTKKKKNRTLKNLMYTYICQIVTLLYTYFFIYCQINLNFSVFAFILLVIYTVFSNCIVIFITGIN